MMSLKLTVICIAAAMSFSNAAKTCDQDETSMVQLNSRVRHGRTRANNTLSEEVQSADPLGVWDATVKLSHDTATALKKEWTWPPMQGSEHFHPEGNRNNALFGLFGGDNLRCQVISAVKDFGMGSTGTRPRAARWASNVQSLDQVKEKLNDAGDETEMETALGTQSLMKEKMAGVQEQGVFLYYGFETDGEAQFHLENKPVSRADGLHALIGYGAWFLVMRANNDGDDDFANKMKDYIGRLEKHIETQSQLADTEISEARNNDMQEEEEERVKKTARKWVPHTGAEKQKFGEGHWEQPIKYPKNYND